MIGFLRGVLLKKQPPLLILDVDGVGYEIEAPMTTFYTLPDVGNKIESDKAKYLKKEGILEGEGSVVVTDIDKNTITTDKIEYFEKPSLQIAVWRPFTIVNRKNEFDVKCSVKGGGLSGQAGAIIHGISRALVEFEPNLKTILKKEKLTTRDSRSVERKKYGHRKARRSFQFSKR